MLKHLALAGPGDRSACPVARSQERLAQTASQPVSAEEVRKADAQSEEEWYYSVGI
jgi:hypothetical protein